MADARHALPVLDGEGRAVHPLRRRRRHSHLHRSGLADAAQRDRPTGGMDAHRQRRRSIQARWQGKERLCLFDAARLFRIPAIPESVKKRWRDVAIRGAPFTAEEKQGLLRYCRTDVDLTVRVLMACGTRRAFPIRARSAGANARAFSRRRRPLLCDRHPAVHAGGEAVDSPCRQSAPRPHRKQGQHLPGLPFGRVVQPSDVRPIPA